MRESQRPSATVSVIDSDAQSSEELRAMLVTARAGVVVESARWDGTAATHLRESLDGAGVPIAGPDEPYESEARR